MNSVITLPFIHTAWLLVAGAGAVAAGRLLPQRAWRLPAALAVGVLLAVILTALGFVPFHGQLHLAAYGFFMLSAFVVAYVLCVARARRIGIEERQVVDVALIALIAGLAGARARYVWERPHEFLVDASGQHRALSDTLAQMVDFDRGGMVWYGGLTLATLSILIYALSHRIRVLAFADTVVPALLAGLGVGRIGCFFNGCCYGRPTTLPWAIHHDGQLIHPTQLYETLACSLLALVLWWGWRHRRADGVVTLVGVLGYSIWRFINEGLRGDDRIPSTWLGLRDPHGSIDFSRTFSLPLDTSQVTGIHLVLLALVVALGVHLYRRAHPDARWAATQVPGSVHARPAAITTPTVHHPARSSAPGTDRVQGR